MIFKNFKSTFKGRLLFVLLAIVILLHMVLFVLYAQHNKRAETKVNRDIVIQQVINLVERINYTNVENRKAMVKAVDIPNISLSLDNKPKSKLHFKSNTSLWRISQAIRGQGANLALSLQYAPNTWLNITAAVGKNAWWWFQIFLISLELVVVIAIIFSIWSINRFAIPLRNFKKAAERLGVDLDSPPLREYGPAIVRETAHTMNQLQMRISDLIKERTNMLAALSHDLRTPMTRIKLRSQLIEDKELFQKNITDIDEMEAMIAETLAFAKNNARLEELRRIDLYSLLQTIVEDFQSVGHDVSLTADIRKIPIGARPISLKRAMNNLIDNACKYGKIAKIHCMQQNSRIFIYIDDEGPGIKEGLLEKVFEPFYRGERSRSRETGGTGLGLAVTRDIIRSHRGTIKLENRASGGLRVIISFLIL